MDPQRDLIARIGWLSRRRVPRSLRRPLYQGFARYAGADLSLLDCPLDDFERFDDFFTRPLLPGARPTAAGTEVVVSPVDGKISEIGVAEGGRLLQCKGLDYTVRGLLADAPEAAAFEGGAYVTLYLAPRDYHRIHAPIGGRVVGYQHIPGTFFPVNPLSVRNVPGLFSINERLVTYLDSEVGRVAVVKVAATGVGHITLSYDADVHTHRHGQVKGARPVAQRYGIPKPVDAGGELGRSSPRLDGDLAVRAGSGAPRRASRRSGAGGTTNRAQSGACKRALGPRVQCPQGHQINMMRGPR